MKRLLPRVAGRAGLLAMASLLLAGCGSTSASVGSGVSSSIPHPNVKGETLNYITTSSTDYSHLVQEHAIAVLRGWGVSVNATSEDSGNSQIIISDFLRGDVDVISNSVPTSLGQIIDSHVPLVAFSLTAPRQDYAFLTRPDITSLKQLKGKAIGVCCSVPSTLNYQQGVQVVKAAGLATKDVHIVALGSQSVRAAALLSGRVDGTMLGYSNWLTLKSQGFHLLYSYTEKQPNEIDDPLWASQKWLNAHKNLAIAYNLAMLESYHWFNTSKPDFVKTAVAEIKGTDKATASGVYDLYKKYKMYPENTVLTTQMAQYNEGFTNYSSSQIPPLSQWVDTSFAQQALKMYKSGS